MLSPGRGNDSPPRGPAASAGAALAHGCGALALTGGLVTVPALAHTGVQGPRDWNELAGAWEWDPLLIVMLLLTGWLYRRGTRRLRARVSAGRGLRGWEIGCFWAGWWTLVAALASPLHPWGRVLFSAHMTQHELLMVAAAPLLVLGRPLVAFLFAVPTPDARQISRLARVGWWQATWRVLTQPFVAWAVHAVALWVWHVPRFFQATLTSDFVHDLQHISFFGSALLFWWSLIHGRAGLQGFGVAVLYVFTTMLHSGLLGALLTFANVPIYPAYAAGAGAWSLTALEDQQLGGVIMWVPAGLVYIVAALALVAGWMRQADRADPLRLGEIASSKVALALAALLLLSGCGGSREREAAALTGGDPRLGRATIQRVGCGACHTIPGVAGADARVGPPLRGIASRSYVGGVLTNTPENMVQWLLDPPRHAPRTVMPNLRLTDAEARDVAAYLYTLRE